nr:hypothetical protein [Nitrosomonas nitrosa]
MTQANETPPTIITLTLPTPEGGGIAPERATATLLIQRGELAHLRQFHYNGQMADLIVAIREAHDALGLVEDQPPVIPDLPEEKSKLAPKTKAKAAQKPSVDEEPTIDIPLKKGTKAIKISHLKIVGGETDAAAYRQAALIAGKLIDGKLWDGESPIRIDDVYAVEKRMKYLTDKDLSLFTLDDFVQVGAAADVEEAASEGSAAQAADSETDSLPPVNPAALEGVVASSNGQRPDDETDPISLT